MYLSFRIFLLLLLLLLFSVETECTNHVSIQTKDKLTGELKKTMYTVLGSPVGLYTEYKVIQLKQFNNSGRFLFFCIACK